MIRLYYIGDADATGGVGGGDPNVPAIPKGYVPTTPQQRSDWNAFLDYAGKQPNSNLTDAAGQAALLAQYKKANPNFSVTAQQIPAIQYEAYQLRKGDKLGNLGSKELGYIRQGLSSNFLNADTSSVGKLYYPQMGQYGTDLENYYNSKFNPALAKPVDPAPAAAPAPPAVAAIGPAAAPGTPAPEFTITSSGQATPQSAAPVGGIPRPDYSNPESRQTFAAAFRDKYGKDVLGGYGDIPLRVNEKPQWGSDSTKNLVNKEAKRLGLDPELLYSSAMIEGMSGYYPQKNRTTGAQTVKWTGDKDYPVSGLWGFGLDSLEDYLPALKKKGYLPQDFEKNYKVFEGEGGPKGKDIPESVMFKTTDAGLQAKAAMMRQFYDEFDDYTKEKGIKLTPEQRNFFALAHFNSGRHGYEMLDAYNKAGLLKNNDFLKSRPNVPIQAFIDFYKGNKEKAEKLHSQIFGNVTPRLAAAAGLKQEQLLK